MMDTNERDDMSPESEQEMPDKILGMDADKFVAGYAEMQSEEAEFKEFGFIPTKDYTGTPGMNFMLDLFRPSFERDKMKSKIVNPVAVKKTKILIDSLRTIFPENTVKIELDAHPNYFNDAAITITCSTVVIEKQWIRAFLAIVNESHGIDVEAHINGNVVITLGVDDYWKAVETDDI